MTVPQTEPLNLPATMEPDNPLWRYALACWQNPELAQACLTLQTRDWSVTRILCAGWLGVNGHLFTGVEDAKVTEWRARVTGSIRSARKSIPRHHNGCRDLREALARAELQAEDRKSTRLNSSHVRISYAVFCLKKKKKTRTAMQNEKITKT